jgi:nicotinamidase-related amidase
MNKREVKKMNQSAFVIIDLQNDITKNYREIIDNVNRAVLWAQRNNMIIVYIKHNNLLDSSKNFKPNSHGAMLVPELKVVSDHVFVKTKGNALTSEDFCRFIQENNITEFYLAGADATACVKSTSYNMTKLGYVVHVFSDCITSYDKKKIPEMIDYYEKKGCQIIKIDDVDNVQ